MPVNSSAIASLRHLYKNMIDGKVRDASEAKRIAEGLLSPTIALLEREEALKGPKQQPLTGNQLAHIVAVLAADDLLNKGLPLNRGELVMTIVEAIEVVHGIRVIEESIQTSTNV